MYPLSPPDIKGANIATWKPSLSRFEAHFYLGFRFDEVAALDRISSVNRVDADSRKRMRSA